MGKLTSFRLLLVLQFIGLLVYTVIAFRNEGTDLFSIFFESVLSMGWSGQFNLDFLSYLVLSGLWIMWRDKFSATAVLKALAASIIGYLFFAPYLLWLLFKEKGNLKRVLTGDRS